MFDFLEEIGNFVMQRIGVEGTGILLLAAALIYIWFQHHRSSILEERLSLSREEREAAEREAARALEKLSKPPDTEKKPSPEATEQDSQELYLTAQEFYLAIGKASQHYARKVWMEVLERLAETNQKPRVDQPNLKGKWKGLVNGKDEVIEIKQSGPMVYLKGTVLNDDGTDDYMFTGEGRLISNILVFSWQAEHTNGTNIMTLSPKGNVLDGKYINHFGASGDERYELIDTEEMSTLL